MLNGSKCERYLDRFLVQGSGDDVEHEISLSQSGVSQVPYEELRQHAVDIMRRAVPCRLSPLPWHVVVRSKGLKKSLGPPLQYTLGNYENFLAALIGAEKLTDENREEAYRAMERYMENVEKAVLEGAPFYQVYSAAPKNDTVKEKKLAELRLRSLCGPGIVSLLMTVRWFGAIDDAYKEMSQQAYAVQNPRTYVAKTLPLRRCWTFGLDQTAYDKTVPVDLFASCLAAYFDRADLSALSEVERDRLDRYFYSDLVCAAVVCPTGALYLLCGTMPSGIRLTSGLNNLTHEVAAACIRRLTGRTMRLVCTGDDSVYGSPLKADAEWFAEHLPEMYGTLFGFKPKIEKMASGELFPPGVFPPYLSLVEHWVSSDAFILVSADPGRSVASSCFRATGANYTNEVDEINKHTQVLEGLIASRKADFYGAMYCGIPLPTPLRALTEQCCDHGVMVADRLFGSRAAARPVVVDGRAIAHALKCAQVSQW